MNNAQEERTVINLNTFKAPVTESQKALQEGGETLLYPLGELAAMVGNVEAQEDEERNEEEMEAGHIQIRNDNQPQWKEVRFQQLQQSQASPRTLNELVRSQKLAVSPARRQQIRDKIESNHIKMIESKLTYNPYHLSSYQPTSQAADARSTGDEVQHDLVKVASSAGAQSLEANAGGAQKEAADHGDDAKMIYAQKRATHGYGAEIRKQLKKKQEMEDINKSSVQRQQLLSGFGGAANPQREKKGSRAKGHQSQVLGVRGERANMTKTKNCGALAREQMTSIEEMQAKIQADLERMKMEKLQAKPAIQQVRSSQDVAALPARAQGLNINMIYKLDQAAGPQEALAGNSAQLVRIVSSGPQQKPGTTSIPNNRRHQSFKIQNEHAYGQWRGKSGTLRFGRAPTLEATKSLKDSQSHLSSYRRRKEAQEALESYVQREELKSIPHATVNSGLSNLPGSIPVAGNSTECELKEQAMEMRSTDAAHLTFKTDHEKTATIDREKDSNSITQDNRGSKGPLNQRIPGSKPKEREKSIEMTIRDQSPTPAMMRSRHLDATKRRSGLSGVKDNASTLRKQNEIVVNGRHSQIHRTTNMNEKNENVQTKLLVHNSRPGIPSGARGSGSQFHQTSPQGSTGHLQSQNSQRFAIFSSYQSKRNQHKSQTKMQQPPAGIARGIEGGLAAGSAGLVPNERAGAAVVSQPNLPGRSRSGEGRTTSPGAPQGKTPARVGAQPLLKHEDQQPIAPADNLPAPVEASAGHLREQSFGATLIVNSKPPGAAEAPQVGVTAPPADDELVYNHIRQSPLPSPGKTGKGIDQEQPVNDVGNSIETAPLGHSSPQNQVLVQEQETLGETSETPLRAKRSSMAVPQAFNDEVGGLELVQAANEEAQRQGRHFEGVPTPPEGIQTDHLVSERGQILPYQGADVAEAVKKAGVFQPEQTGAEEWHPDGQVRLNALPSGQSGGFSATAGMIASGGGANHVVRIPNMDSSSPAGEHRQEQEQAAFGNEHQPPSSAGRTQGSGNRTNLFKQLMAVKNSQMSQWQTGPPGESLVLLNKEERRQTAPSGRMLGARRPIHAMSHGLGQRKQRGHLNKSCYANHQINPSFNKTNHMRDDSQQTGLVLRQHGHYSNVAFKIQADAHTSQRRNKELRNLLEVNERKKLQFVPTPSRFGLKFKNKSEEERYLKLSGKITQLDYMDPSQIQQLHLTLKRFLAEYQNTFVTSYYGYPNQVDQRFVIKFIDAVRGLHEEEQKQLAAQAKAGNEAKANDGMSKYWAECGSTAGGDCVEYGGASSQARNAQNQNRGAESRGLESRSQATVNFASTAHRDRERGTTSVQRQTGSSSKQKPITVLNFIRQIYGLEPVAARPGALSSDGGQSQSPPRFTLEDGEFEEVRPRGCIASRLRQHEEEEESDDPEKWRKEEMWPIELWHPCGPALDPAEMYDGRRRDGRRQVVIPEQIERRNDELVEYINKHKTTNMHETQLPCILNTNYYKGKQAAYTGGKILNRLQEKHIQKPLTTVNSSISHQFANTPTSQGGGRHAYYSSMQNLTQVVEARALQSGHGSATNARKTHSSSHVQQHRHPRQSSRDGTAGRHVRPLLYTDKPDCTAGLKVESMIRRNKLTLEHIMAERGKHVAEDKVIAELHQELRNLEAKEKAGEVITIVRGAYGAQQ